MSGERILFFFPYEISGVDGGYGKMKVQNEFFSICLEEVVQKNDEWEIVNKGIVYLR